MTSLLRRCLPNLLLIATAISVGYAQDTSNASCTEVRVYASVLNSRNQVVAGLELENFSAQLNGKPARIKLVEHSQPQPRVVILIDHSGSMGPRWEAVHQVTLDILKHLPEQTAVSIVVFDQTIRQLVTGTRDRQVAVTAAEQFFPANQPKTTRTRLFDALSAALSIFAPGAAGDTMFAITDGGDNRSDAEQSGMEQRLVKSRTRLFVALLTGLRPATAEEREAPMVFSDLARKTGGMYFESSLEDNRKLTSDQISRLAQWSIWLVQNMVDDYELTLAAEQPLAAKAKVKLHVSIPDLKNEKFQVMTQPIVSTGCL